MQIGVLSAKNQKRGTEPQEMTDELPGLYELPEKEATFADFLCWAKLQPQA